jgi:hypothetical protein
VATREAVGQSSSLLARRKEWSTWQHVRLRGNAAHFSLGARSGVRGNTRGYGMTMESCMWSPHVDVITTRVRHLWICTGTSHGHTSTCTWTPLVYAYVSWIPCNMRGYAIHVRRAREVEHMAHVDLRYNEAATYARCAYATHWRRRWQATSCCMGEAHGELYAAARMRHMLGCRWTRRRRKWRSRATLRSCTPSSYPSHILSNGTHGWVGLSRRQSTGGQQPEGSARRIREALCDATVLTE